MALSCWNYGTPTVPIVLALSCKNRGNPTSDYTIVYNELDIGKDTVRC